ncbi:MAG: sulfatase family protein [Puniceicoccales bacterium]
MTDRPNILWISFEDTNPFYGCYGDPIAQTPNVDRFAAESCRWPQAYSTAGVCAPSRSAIITGQYAISMGAHHMRTTHETEGAGEMPTPYSAVIPPHVKCFSEYLRRAGYYCTNCQKTDYQFESPVTAWDELNLQAHWRNRPDPDQPFFSVFNLETSHESGMWEDKSPAPVVDPAKISLPPYFPDTPKVRESMARMYANIAHNDKKFGELLQQLEEDGLADNTIVFHWSDHGPLPRGKRWPYDSGIHIPMIVRWPGELEAGSICHDLVSSIDLAPTVMSLVGLDIPSHMQGQAFLGQDITTPREFIFASRDRHDCTYDRVRAVRDHRFKYIRNYYPDAPRAAWNRYLDHHPIQQEIWRLHLQEDLTPLQETLFFAESRPVNELYDTETDPYEINNLANDPSYADALNRLQSAMDTWLDEVGDWGEIPESEMVRRWYPDGVQPQTIAPVAVCNQVSSPGFDVLPEQISAQAPAALVLQSVTQGASIAFRYADDRPDRWRLYTGPIRLESGEIHIETQAIRIGYQPSEIRTFRLTVSEPA